MSRHSYYSITPGMLLEARRAALNGRRLSEQVQKRSSERASYGSPAAMVASCVAIYFVAELEGKLVATRRPMSRVSDSNGIWRGLEREITVELVLARESIREQ